MATPNQTNDQLQTQRHNTNTTKMHATQIHAHVSKEKRPNCVYNCTDERNPTCALMTPNATRTPRTAMQQHLLYVRQRSKSDINCNTWMTDTNHARIQIRDVISCPASQLSFGPCPDPMAGLARNGWINKNPGLPKRNVQKETCTKPNDSTKRLFGQRSQKKLSAATADDPENPAATTTNDQNTSPPRTVASA